MRTTAVLLAAGSLLLANPADAELTPEEERGKLIYLRGESASGNEITALMGNPPTEVPASVIPCGSCHGRDGRGRPEGGLSPSDLTWSALTKPYGVEHPGGRKHPPYDERSVKRAITMGFDPAGNELHVGMPRYRFGHQDLADLVAYVRRLGQDPDPGLTEDAIRLVTLAPREGSGAPLGEALAAVLAARFDDVNQSGGIYNRRLELEVLPAPEDAAARAGVLRDWLAAGKAFAVVGAFLPGAEAELAAVARELETPLVGPFTFHPQVDVFDPNPWVFYVLPGVDDLCRALVRFAAEEASAEPPRAAVVSVAGLDAARGAIVDKAGALGWPEVATAAVGSNGPDLGPLADAGIDAVFLLAFGDTVTDFMARAAARGWYPRVYLPGSFAGAGIFDAPAGFKDRIFLAYPSLPASQDPRALQKYRDLAARHPLPPHHLGAQISALGAAEVLIEGLKRTGRELSRGGLLDALEGFVELDTGLLPPVSYGPNRRVGIQGGYVVAVDLEKKTLVPASRWIEAW